MLQEWRSDPQKLASRIQHRKIGPELVKKLIDIQSFSGLLRGCETVSRHEVEHFVE